METLTLSILTPAVPSRLTGNASGSLAALCLEIERQIGRRPVEHLVFLDNKKRTVGEKRDALLRMARGQYVAFVDDDDWISNHYIDRILSAVDSRPDVITFRQIATVNGCASEIEFKLGQPNEPFQSGGLTRRNAWHVCAWRRQLAIQSHFPASNYGEDWEFAAPLCALPGLKEAHIPEVLHYYRHDARTTEAPPPA